MIDSIVDTGFAALLTFGLPALFVLFVCKGAIVGKPFPTTVFLPGYIVAVSASRRTIVASIVVASLGYTCGQLLIYWLAAARGREAVASLPRVSISDDQYARAERWFQRYAGAGIVVTNLVPYVGSFIMIPAGIAAYPIGRAACYALASTLLNYALIVWAVLESVRFLTG